MFLLKQYSPGTLSDTLVDTRRLIKAPKIGTNEYLRVPPVKRVTILDFPHKRLPYPASQAQPSTSSRCRC